MANSSIILTSLDFDTLKNTFKAYLKSQSVFNDYNFEGSNLNVLLDLLSYNTYHNSFYVNMVGNEMFLDSAQLRDSAVSHAKELNYTPRSFNSAEATINMTVSVFDLTRRSLVIPKGYTFSSRNLNNNYTFSLDRNVVLTDYTVEPDRVTFYGNDITLYEGYYVTDTYTYTYDNGQRYIISNKNVDISSLTVTVLEDAGATKYTYKRASSLFDIDYTSKVYFIQGAENDSYEIVFGDGVNGRKPKNNSVITIEYRICNGELPNGCNEFLPDGSIENETIIKVVTTKAAAGGNISESIDSIKYNAPRHFTTQERAITTEDYETLLRLNFPEVNAVTAYGGEDLDPPQYGKVFVAVDLKEVDALPDIKKTAYYSFLKPRSPVSIDPVFVDPEYTYIGVKSNVKYNVNTTNLTFDDVKTIVSSSILAYAQTNLNNFNRVFRYSKLVQAIDNSQVSIISNETDINLIKYITGINDKIGTYATFDLDFDVELNVEHYGSRTAAADIGDYSIYTTPITYKGIRSFIRDDGYGTLIAVSSDTHSVIESVGTIDYASGKLQFSGFKMDSYEGNGVKVFATPKAKDIATSKNVILNIIEEDIKITAIAVRG